MPAIKSAGEIAEKWVRVTPGRTEDYRAGVQKPKVDWEEATVAAEDRWGSGLDTARAEGLFPKGVREAGTRKWQQGAVQKGVPRWPEGVRLGQDAYESGFSPFRDVIERTTLPPRGRRGDPANIERVRAIADALHRARVGG